MDMLGRIREEARNQAKAHRLGLLQPSGREAPALLLAGLPSPLIADAKPRRRGGLGAWPARPVMLNLFQHPASSRPASGGLDPETSGIIIFRVPTVEHLDSVPRRSGLRGRGFGNEQIERSLRQAAVEVLAAREPL
jgi:hypothetical protein